MKNLVTFKVESILGATFISVLSIFFVSILFIEMKNFNSDTDIMAIDTSSIKFISSTERIEIQNWVRSNNIKIPSGQGYRYVLRTYPDKPWLE